jgi:hypothetical protein
MKRQPFTIGGSVPLKKALLEEIGLDLYTQVCAAIADNDKEAMKKHFKCVYDAIDSTPILTLTECKYNANYQLPEDWNEAVAAVKEFFREEHAFKAGKWYYGEIESKFLLRYQETRPVNHFHFNDILYTELIRINSKGTVVYSTDNYISSNQLEKTLQPATKEQIQEMLSKVAEHKGYIGGAKIKSIYGAEGILSRCAYYIYQNDYDRLLYGDYTIYEKGKWAEIVVPQEEEPKPEKLVLKGVQFGNGVNMLGAIADLHLTDDHLEQLRAYFNK